MSPAGGGRVAVRVCTTTTGFFVLARCERPARIACNRCTRSICNRHMLQLPNEPVPVCPECYAAARGFVDDPMDEYWTVGFRRNYYWSASEATGDTLFWSEFDSYDQMAFDPELYGGDEFADDTGDDGSFFDS
ncbi:MAG: hypothetical protein HYX32_00730 [Actinobacteria bacterium]|nr:hypothetical protein [Actinomycetota bacterium]